MKTILVATDLGPNSRHALERALLVASAHDAHLHVVHVAQGQDRHADEMLRQQVQQALGKLETELEDEFRMGLRPPSVKTIVGAVETGVVAEAVSVGADLVVAGLSHHSRDAGIEGTILERILLAAKVPLLVVKSAPTRGYEVVLVGIYLSPASRRALETALKVAPAARFIVVHALEDGSRIDEAAEDRLRAEIVRLVRDCFNVARQAVGAHEADIQVVIETGPVVRVIDHHVQRFQPDLVAFAKHSRGPAVEYIGSGARGLLQSLTADMLVVGEPPRAD
jgi:nucleotide-binding universal stress UspA family protein